MATSPDTTTPVRYDDSLLRQFVAARDARDEEAARLAWNALVAANLKRLRNWVWGEGRTYLSEIELDDAESLAIEKLVVNMISTFEGSSMGEWVNATKRLVWFSCKQIQRDAAKNTEHTAPLHTIGDGGEFTDGQTAAVNTAAIKATDAELADEYERLKTDELRDSYFAALPQLTEGQQEAIELMYAGYSTEEICARLDMQSDAVYQATSRGMKKLRELRQEATA